MLVTLLFFIVGSLLATAQIGFWTALPAIDSGSLLDLYGLPRALTLQLVLIGGLAALTRWIERRHGGRAPTREPMPPVNWWRGPWPLGAGASALVAVNVATLLLAGHPWAITFAFGLWGAKALDSLGFDVAAWPYWYDRHDVLAASIWTDVTSVMNLGIVVGAMAAAVAFGRFRPGWRLGAGDVVTAMLGGLLLGYGARLAYGCNIGAYFSGVASGSLHGWLWLACAFLGFWLTDAVLRPPVPGRARPARA
jgi:hypothetical protein